MKKVAGMTPIRRAPYSPSILANNNIQVYTPSGTIQPNNPHRTTSNSPHHNNTHKSQEQLRSASRTSQHTALKQISRIKHELLSRIQSL